MDGQIFCKVDSALEIEVRHGNSRLTITAAVKSTEENISRFDVTFEVNDNGSISTRKSQNILIREFGEVVGEMVKSTFPDSDWLFDTWFSEPGKYFYGSGAKNMTATGIGGKAIDWLENLAFSNSN